MSSLFSNMPRLSSALPPLLLSLDFLNPLLELTLENLSNDVPFSSYPHRLELLSIYSIRHRRLKAQLVLLYKFIAGASHFPYLNSFIRLSSSSRRPMFLIYLSPLSVNFFSFIVPIWNAIVANVDVFLPPPLPI